MDDDSNTVTFRQAGITHHDIKDENVLINVQTLEAKVIDFGCARPVSNAPVSQLILDLFE